MAAEPYHPLMRIVAWSQGAYYVTTGIWPILNISSFEWVTGPKVDDWLVQTVGLLLVVSGLVFLTAAWRRQFTVEVMLLAVGNALCLTLVDVVFVSFGRISPIYLADVAVELVIIGGWMGGRFLPRRSCSAKTGTLHSGNASAR